MHFGAWMRSLSAPWVAIEPVPSWCGRAASAAAWLATIAVWGCRCDGGASPAEPDPRAPTPRLEPLRDAHAGGAWAGDAAIASRCGVGVRADFAALYCAHWARCGRIEPYGIERCCNGLLTRWRGSDLHCPAVVGAREIEACYRQLDALTCGRAAAGDPLHCDPLGLCEAAKARERAEPPR